MPLLLAALLVALLGGCDALIDRQIERAATRADTGVLEGPDLTIVLCGTGSPLADRSRAGACTAVIGGGELVLVDVGPGSWREVDLANLPTSRVSAILLTHFHSDHIGDLGEAVTQSWIAGRSRPLDVYGPPGTARVVAGFQSAYTLDADYRTVHHGEAFLPKAAATAVAHEVAPGDGNIVFERNGLRVTMFPVDHHPVEPAVGYRFDYRGRSVVISGDTRKSESLVRHATDADILVHEALDADLIGRVVAVMQRRGNERLAKLAGDIPGYHTTPREAGEVARDARVGHLVLSHLVPPAANLIGRRRFLSQARQTFSGQVTIGAEGMRFALAPASGR